MIRKLRRKFILTACGAVLLVLALMVFVMNVLNYRDITAGADTLLGILAENGGEMMPGSAERPDFFETGEMPDFPEPPADGSMPEGQGRQDADVSKEDGRPWERDARGKGFFGRNGMLTAETPFESRYFSVVVDKASGEVLSTETENIAAVDGETAGEYARSVLSKGREKGFYGVYRYVVCGAETDGEDAVRIIFLDCARSRGNFSSFLLFSILAAAGAFLLASALIVIVSRRIFRPVAESYEKQKTFITDASHELRTPITTIEADASVLEMEIGENEWLEDIRKQSRRLTDLTGELTYLSRMDEKRNDRPMIEFPLSDLVSETADSFAARAALSGKTIRREIAPGLTYTGDENAVRKLISILLDNAMKYSPDGSAVDVVLRERNRGFLLTVRNDAESVEEETVKHMFDRFYRGDRSRSSEKGGFGIGLSIARSIVDAHKGKITAASPDGRSLQITVTM